MVERKKILDRVRNTISKKDNKDHVVFVPTQEELKEIIPEGNKVRIERIGNYEWAFGTKKFTFTRDQHGRVYARTQKGEILFDDFVAVNEISEMKKAIHTNIRNATFSDDSQDLAEADFAIVGNEMDGVDESDASLADKMKKFNQFN